ncbi:MAG: DUF134 domain-containing protein [Pseudodesulfovibrio sp.]
MGRRKIQRFVKGVPQAVFFKPQGIPMRELEQKIVSIDGFEALRLVDYQGKPQQEAADLMGISRPTLSRVLSEARTAVAAALTNGWAIRIEGGDYSCHDETADTDSTDMAEHSTGGSTMPGFNQTNKNGQGRGQGNGQGRGQGCGQGNGQEKGQQRRCQATTPAQSSNISINQDKEKTVNTIAISSEGPTLDDRVDPRFGRTGGFVIVELDTMKTNYVDNGNSQVMAQGAGIQAAETVANAGAQVILTGYVGPKAFTALSAAGIRVGQDVKNMTIREAVDAYKRGDIEIAESPNSTGGHGK